MSWNIVGLEPIDSKPETTKALYPPARWSSPVFGLGVTSRTELPIWTIRLRGQPVDRSDLGRVRPSTESGLRHCCPEPIQEQCLPRTTLPWSTRCACDNYRNSCEGCLGNVRAAMAGKTLRENSLTYGAGPEGFGEATVRTTTYTGSSAFLGSADMHRVLTNPPPPAPDATPSHRARQHLPPPQLVLHQTISRNGRNGSMSQVAFCRIQDLEVDVSAIIGHIRNSASRHRCNRIAGSAWTIILKTDGGPEAALATL